MAMKRVLGTFAAIILAASLVTGCGKSEATSQQAPSASAEEESADAEAEPADSNDESAEAVEAESEELTEESKVDEIKEEQPLNILLKLFPFDTFQFSNGLISANDEQ